MFFLIFCSQCDYFQGLTEVLTDRISVFFGNDMGGVPNPLTVYLGTEAFAVRIILFLKLSIT